jgi:hypothetical protein
MKFIYSVIILLVIYNSAESQSYFDVNKEFPCEGCPNVTADLNSLKHYSLKEVNDAFDSISKAGIEFHYPQGGCQQRAQIMSMFLTKKYKIQHFRVWLFAPVDLIKNDKRTLEIFDKNGLAPHDTINWNYHVVPCVLAEDGGKVDTLIIDPSLNPNGPTKLRDWLKAITNSDVSKYSFLDSKWYFFNTFDNGSSPVLNGFFYDYSLTNFCSDAVKNVTLEKGLAENDLVEYILNKYLKPTPGDTSRFNAFRPYLGQITVLENNFLMRVGYCGTNSNSISFRSLMENYSPIINDAMRYYQDRLTYWILKVDELR